MTSADE